MMHFILFKAYIFSTIILMIMDQAILTLIFFPNPTSTILYNVENSGSIKLFSILEI